MAKKLYYQSGKLIKRIDWDKILPMSRYAGGHDEQMKGLLKNVKIIAHWNEGGYDGSVATCIQLKDTKEIVIYSDYYGSCSGCDAWEDASDEDVKRMCIQLASGSYIFKNIKDCIGFLKKRHDSEESFYDDVRIGLLSKINEPKRSKR